MQSIAQSLGNNKKFYEEMAKKYCPTVLEEINSYQPKTAKEAPHELVVFRRTSKDQKRDSEAKFYKQEFIKDYLDVKWTVEVYNRDSFRRLYELLQENPDLHYQICLKLNQFKNAIMRTDHPYLSIGIGFSKFKWDENVSEQVAWDE